MSSVISRSLEDRFQELTRNSPQFKSVPFQLSIDPAKIAPRELAGKASAYVGTQAATDEQMAKGLAQVLVRSWPGEGVDMPRLRTELAVLVKNPHSTTIDRTGASLLLDAMAREAARTPPRI